MTASGGGDARKKATCAHCGAEIDDVMGTPICQICKYHICGNCNETNCPKGD